MRLLLAVAALALTATAPAPGTPDAEAMAGHEEWMKSQHNSRAQWCCDLSDGRPAEVRGTPGRYEVLYSREHWPEGNDTWLPVPNEALLPTPSPILLPIAWIYHGRVLCLAMPAAS